MAVFEALLALIIEMKLSKLLEAAAGIYFSKAVNPEERPLLVISCSHFWSFILALHEAFHSFESGCGVH